MPSPALDHEVQTLAGAPRSLADYRGQVLLIVNTASACGLTPQYHALEALHQRFKARGFSVLAFPCNDFGAQEPGTPEEIQRFCDARFSLSFPLFAKVRATGDKSPLYRTLTEELPEGLRGEIRWNFTKFVVGKDGVVSHRFEPQIEPLAPEVMQAVEDALTA